MTCFTCQTLLHPDPAKALPVDLTLFMILQVEYAGTKGYDVSDVCDLTP